jgi:Alcohol dehydrogenase GroES-like domain
VPEPGRGQVRIRVQAAPVNPNDLHMLRGRYGLAPDLPAVLGQESVGVLDALGEGVGGFTIGQRVITIGVTGTWQEYVVADAGRVLAVPGEMSASTAAQLLTNPLTAAAAQFLSAISFPGGTRQFRLVPTRANSQPAFGCYLRDAQAPIAHAHGLIVLTLASDRISAITRFLDNSVLPQFGLPRTLRE